MGRGDTRRRKMTAMARPSTTGGRWRRRLGALAALAVLVLAGVGALTVPSGLEDRFRIAALEVHGLRLLRGSDVLQASGVAVGDRLFAVDLDSTAARLDRLVWVRQVRVERKPPDRLVVHLVERRRLLWVDWQGRLHGLDHDGVLLPPERLPGEGVADLDLPVLRLPAGLDDSLAVGSVVTDSTARQLLAWWRMARRADPELAAQISQIEPLDAGSVKLRLVADDLEVRLPQDDVAARLAVLRRVLERVYHDGPEPAYVDLRFAGQAVIGTQAARLRRDRRSGRSGDTGGEESDHG